MEKKTVLIFTEYYLPGFKAGGPIRSVSNLVEWLGEEYHFKIVTSDRDYTEPEKYADIAVNQWNRVGKAEVFYVGLGTGSLAKIYKILKNETYKLIIFNSFVCPKFTIIPLILARLWIGISASKLVITPRGELSQDALDIKKTKKKSFLHAIKFTKLYNNLNWFFTNEKEKNEFFSQINIPYRSIHSVPNLPKKISPAVISAVQKTPGSIRIIFLSRLARIKNLDYALEVLRSVQDIEISFDIYGVRDDLVFWEKCQNLIQMMPKNIKVNYAGVVAHNKVPDILSDYHLFFLPTKSENFGHAIYESMLSGTPVLISDQTPWQELKQKGLGWDLPLQNPMKFREIIKELAALDSTQINTLKRQVHETIHQHEVKESVDKNQKAFKTLIDDIIES